ncbi:MTL5 protein, partial [Eolophus roseicapillus]|nr:MTL5 protein [Eolophus roseicapilla]
MSMEISFGIIDSGLATVIFSQNSPVSSENLNLETIVINNPIEEGLRSSQDTVNVEENLLDHFKYPLTNENQDTLIKVEEQPHGNNSCDEDLEKYKELNLPEEAEYSPYLPSNSVPLLSSVVMQHKHPSVPTSKIFSPEGRVNQKNVRTIPVFRSFIPPAAGENKGICYDQFKGIQNSTMQLQNLTNCLNESASDMYGLPQTGASVYDEIHEVRETVSNVTENQQDRAIFQSSNVDDSGCKLLALHNVMEESRCSHRNDCNPVVICQLEGGTQTLCINSCGTQEQKPVHLISEHHNQHNYLQSDVDNPVTAVLGQISPVLGELVLNEQKVKKPCPLNLSLSVYTLFPFLRMEIELLPRSRIQIFTLKLVKILISYVILHVNHRYCDCFANGDFCNNCNCKNCYNNQLHETERFKAIKACLDRNPAAFLPKIEKRELKEIKPHHNKGCNCKRSECLKNYCECFEAKIMCSSICKCIGCKNYEETPDEKTQSNVLNYMDFGNNEENSPVLASTFKMLPKSKKDRQPAVCISWEEVKAVCACLLVQAQEAEERGYSVCLAEQMIMEEFGRCLSQILH